MEQCGTCGGWSSRLVTHPSLGAHGKEGVCDECAKIMGIVETFVSGPKLKRNDPCHCGGGKKYKKCHGR